MKSLAVSSVLIFLLSLNINAQQFKPGFFCFEDAFLLSPGYTFDIQGKTFEESRF